jgi:hypothetical protein
MDLFRLAVVQTGSVAFDRDRSTKKAFPQDAQSQGQAPKADAK